MGIAGKFGFGKKEKIPFKIPGEVSALRTRIEDENRENYPHLARYQELAKHARAVYAHLDDIIAQAVYAEEAFRIKGDIKKKMERLEEKITANRKEADKDGNKDYVENNLEYLERKGRRIQAKTLFTVCLDEIEAIITYFKEERLQHGTTIESTKGELIKAMSALQNNYFNTYGEDKEIKEIRENLIRKIQGLSDFFEENKERFREKGLEAKAQASLTEIVSAGKNLSDEFRS